MTTVDARQVYVTCNPGEPLTPQIRLAKLIFGDSGTVTYRTRHGDTIPLEVWHWPLWSTP